MGLRLRGSAVYILGVSAFFHDSAATLIRDGEIVAAAQEERFSRIKGDAAFPVVSAQECLAADGIGVSSLDAVVYFEKPLIKFDRLMSIYRAHDRSGIRSFRHAFPKWSRHRLKLEHHIRSYLGEGFEGELLFADHHESHAASAFFPSPFEEAAVVTVDAVGEWSTSSIGIGEGNRLTMLREMRFPHSLGMLYSAFTHYTGFKVNSGEYKMMGLAPYGEPRFADLILDHLVDLREDGSMWLNLEYFDFVAGGAMTSRRFHELFGGPPRTAESTIEQRHIDIAASAQLVCEEAMLRITRYAHQLTGKSQLAMAGGVALNCVANGRVLREGPFEELWVQPAAGDAGGSLGAALLAWHHVKAQPRQVRKPDAQQGSLLGPAFRTDDIELFLDGVGAVWHRVDDEDRLLETVVDALEEGRVVGWFHGRMEFGPRALGARSILGDARSQVMQQQMNLKIKFRESFRPFAPCVLRSHAHEVFELEPGQESPYMLLVAPVRPEHRRRLDDEEIARMQDRDLRVRVSVPRSEFPAITHVDWSARVQTVDEERHGRFHRLMVRFYERTDSPVIVNTSFNIRGEPIVCSPSDAYRCFMGTEIDMLVLEDLVLRKEDQPVRPTVTDLEAYQTSYELD
jgi:carbamoyltransferase